MTDNSMQLASGALVAHAVRFKPNDDLVSCLLAAANLAMQQQQQTGSSSACIVLTAVGSLSMVQLRMASASASSDNNAVKVWNEQLEVVSLVGTFSKDGSKHLHMSVSNQHGNVFGGHVMGGTVYTTLEVVFGTMQHVSFAREHDDETGYTELVVEQQQMES
ncbi:hypothetical protein MPSEU_000358300 [Mayamaea pseudoterrestris]|nr:hypothetical protein MPSEU_000358300 [Mayamaea pseudoterrestris]